MVILEMQKLQCIKYYTYFVVQSMSHKMCPKDQFMISYLDTKLGFKTNLTALILFYREDWLTVKSEYPWFVLHYFDPCME